MPAPARRTAYIILWMALFLVSACSSTKEGGKKNDTNVISEEEIYETNAVSLNELIAKRVPGITITQTGDGRILTRIRGRSSFTGDDSPLYVVDGFPTDPMSDGSLPGVLITEIKSIEVLKSPAETARWGMRGAHGVILVTTKEGRGN